MSVDRCPKCGSLPAEGALAGLCPGCLIRTGSGVFPATSQEDLLTPDDLGYGCLAPSDDPGLIGLLGRYEVQEEIGRGGMGIVFRALDPKENRLVAIKVLSPKLAKDELTRQRFLHEGQTATQARHPHLVCTFQVEEAEEIPFLVMEHIQGESLEDRIVREGPLPAEEITRIAIQTAMALDAIHQKGLVHRDIKPGNILLEEETGDVKLTDFGLARATDEMGLTRTGQLVGTPHFMAPEQVLAQLVDPRTDLFSLGSALYRTATASTPFSGKAQTEILEKVCDAIPVPVRDLNPNIPIWLEAIIERLMAKEPDQRFSSARDLIDALKRADKEAPAANRPSTDQRSPKERGGCLGLILTFLAIAIALRLYV